MNGESFSGLGVCPGIAFGRVQVVDRRRVSVPRYHLKPGKLDPELERFERAIEASERQLLELGERASRSGLKEVGSLLEAHTMILRDRVLHDATRDQIIEEQVNAEWALNKVVRKIREIFDGLDQDYFKERRSDVDLVSDRVLRNLVGAETELLNNLSPDAIVVAFDLSPADTIALARYSVKGFVTETGGRTSHIAIFARSMSIPAVLGVHGIMERAGTGDRVVVDGGSGQVLLRPTPAAQTRFRAAERRRAKEEAALLADRHLPAETRDAVRVSLLGNIEVSEEIASVVAHGGEGIGLYRTEFLVIERRRMPTAVEQVSEYRKVVRAMNGLPVTIRTIDIGGDKFMGGGHENAASPPPRAPSSPRYDSVPPPTRPFGGLNPALGMRAIRNSLRDVESFKAQLRAILQSSVDGPVRLLFPFLVGVEELRQARAILDEVKQELREAGTPFSEDVPVGVMIETPAAVWVADALAIEADFFSIGTNDLIQYALAVDRRNDDVAYLYQPCAPSVLRMLQAVAQAAARHQTPVNVCGEMAADPFYVPLLVGLGIRSLSMSAHSIPLVKRLIRRLSVAECEALVQGALQLTTTAEVEAAITRCIEAAGA